MSQSGPAFLGQVILATPAMQGPPGQALTFSTTSTMAAYATSTLTEGTFAYAPIGYWSWQPLSTRSADFSTVVTPFGNWCLAIQVSR